MKLPSDFLDIVVPKMKLSFPEKVLETSQIFTGTNTLRYGGHLYLWQVQRNSPLKLKKATEILAYYLRREEGYDFPQYTVSEHPDKNAKIFLLVTSQDHSDIRAVGWFRFDKPHYSNVPSNMYEAYEFSAVWIHPYLRGKRILTALWPHLRKTFGNDFMCQQPLSISFKKFIEKRGECWLCGVNCVAENHEALERKKSG